MAEKCLLVDRGDCRVREEEDREPSDMECVCCSSSVILEFSQRILTILLDNRGRLGKIDFDAIREDYSRMVVQFAESMIKADYAVESSQKLLETMKGRVQEYESDNPFVG